MKEEVEVEEELVVVFFKKTTTTTSTDLSPVKISTPPCAWAVLMDIMVRWAEA